MYKKDSYEPNETWSTSKYLGSLKEGATSLVLSSAWLHANGPTEIDRYYVYVTESGSLFDWTMIFYASLSGVSGWHSLCIYYDRGCNGGVDVQKCATGSGSLSVNTGDVDANDGTSDDGCVDIEVYGDWSCTPYTLQLTLDP